MQASNLTYSANHAKPPGQRLTDEVSPITL